MNSVTPHRIEMLVPADLKVDASTQRRRDDAHVNRIAANFDLSLIGLIEVSARPDGYYVIDGQHRAAAAIKAGHGSTPLPCYVVDGLSRADEGHRFVGINTGNKRPHAIEVFRIRVVAEDPAAVAIDGIVRDAGFTLALASQDGVISAVTALESVYNGLGTGRHKHPSPALLIDTLSVLRDAWGEARDAYDATMIRAVALLLNRHGDRLDRSRLCHLLGKSGTAGQLIGRARTLSEASRQSHYSAACQVMVAIYNHGLRAGRLKTAGEAS